MASFDTKRFFIVVAKFVAFVAVFYVICLVIAWAARDDSATYTRALMSEFHKDKQVDTIFLGPSHVAHAILPSLYDELRGGGHSFCLGTPSQPVLGAVAVMKEALQSHNIKYVYMECDFGHAHDKDVPYWQREPGKSEFLVHHYLKNKRAKWEYVCSALPPNWWLNDFLPIGKMQLLDLDPRYVYKTVHSKITGEYYDGAKPDLEGAAYGGRGCVLDDEVIPPNSIEGDLNKPPLLVSDVSQTWIDAIDEMIELCKEHGIECIFYTTTCTIYYVITRTGGKYADFNDWYNDFFRERGCQYYDFTLFKGADTSDHCFYDDDHLNKYGVVEFTKNFATLMNIASKEERQALFYPTYSQKIADEKARVLGLLFDETDNRVLKYKAVCVNCDESLVAFDILVQENGHEAKYFEDTKATVVDVPKNGGKIIIDTKYNGERQGHFVKEYSFMIE